MNEILEQFNFSFPENISITNYIINIIITTILLYVLSIVYEKVGQSISNRGKLGRVLILVGVTTFIIISIVKSSLALSLGLVGALSIVRFRTAIKEPEELGFFFIAIAVGLGLGANQLAPTLIGFVFLILILFFLNKKTFSNKISQNILISINGVNEDKDVLIDKLTKLLENNVEQLELKRLSVSKDKINLNYFVLLNSISDIQKITSNLDNITNNIDFSFIDTKV